MTWVPLHVHSQYSILRSSASIEDIVHRAKKVDCPAVALTDQGNLFGAVEFYKECSAHGVRPILGCELYVAPTSRLEKRKISGHSYGCPLTFLVKNLEGYQNLCKLSSAAHLEGFYYVPRIDRELLETCSKGLICLSGPLNGSIATAILQQQEGFLLEEVNRLQQIFGEDFYFELQRHPMSREELLADEMGKEPWLLQKYEAFISDQEQVVQRLRDLSHARGIACVATPDIHYIDREGWRAHEILLNIQSGEACEIWEKDSAGNPKSRIKNPKREVMPSHSFHFPSTEEMQERFADCPEALEQTLKIAEKCSFAFDFKTKYYPVFIPPGLKNLSCTELERKHASEQFLRDLCQEGIPRRYTEEALKHVHEQYPERDPIEVVRSRLSYELDIILSKEMGDYLLIVHDFISWAKSRRIPVGPGRGSGAGSIILYLIGVTDIEPLRFNLFFERFINPERLSYPDIDVDICMERRQEVIDYTMQKYGKDRVAQIITFGTMKAKMVVKDVGRVLSFPLARVNALTKLIPEDPNMTLQKALEIDPELRRQYEQDDEVKRLIDIALELEGVVRNTGIHAAGLIIGGRPLVENIPLCAPKGSEMAVTQFSMKPVEMVGLLKIDFLGLKTLSSIQRAVQAIEERTKTSLAWMDLPLEDKSTFSLLNQGRTQGVFQLESGGMQELAKQLHIDKFEEIIAVGALYRPGPMEMIPSFIQRKHGKEAIEIDHPLMADILAETYGIMVYQEQVMQIASRLAKYSLGEGDVLRRAMGKKDKEEMSRQREKFKTGALQNQINEDLSMKIFDKIEKFASYGFNKSHAAAYGYLSYVTAFLKANYPMEWLAAQMTSDRDDIAKISKIIRESKSTGISILPPSVNESNREFTATLEGIRFAITGIKGIGEGVVDAILEERKAGGVFSSLCNFIQRIDLKRVGKKNIENLIEAGCFDFTGWQRAALLASVDPIYTAVQREQRDKEKGYIDFLSLIGEDLQKKFSAPPLEYTEKSRQHQLQREYELLGFYLREHPLDSYAHMLSKLSCRPLQNLQDLEKSAVCRVACIIESISVKLSAKSQRKFAILVIGDGEESLEVAVWADVYEQFQSLLVENRLIYAVLQAEKEEGEQKLQIKWIGDLVLIDETVIRACDEAYEKVQGQLKLLGMKDRRPKKNMTINTKTEKSIVQENAPTHLRIKVDLDKARLSHILGLKKILRAHPGKNPLTILFHTKAREEASLHISADWGVTWSSSLEQEIRQVVCISEVGPS